MTRLYSAWQDKSRTFRFQNGSVDWDLAQNSTTWIWGTANDTEAQKMMEDILMKHDIYFNPKRFGIDKFEEKIELNIKLCKLLSASFTIVKFNNRLFWMNHFLLIKLLSLSLSGNSKLVFQKTLLFQFEFFMNHSCGMNHAIMPYE